MTQTSMRFGSAQGSVRREDQALVCGKGAFTDDLPIEGALHACFVGSAHGHARIRNIDAAAARAMPGVRRVLTAADVAAAGLGPITPGTAMPNRDGTPMFGPGLPVLAGAIARYAGEPLALVVADSFAQAQAAADSLEVDYEPLPAAARLADAIKPDAPQLWPEAPGNVALDWAHGDSAAVAAAFAQARHRLRLRLCVPRIAPSAMEPRAAIAAWDAASDSYTLTAATQGVALVSKTLAEAVFKIAPQKIRVRTFDVGGGFGMKVQPYAEYAALLLAARLCGAPVRWRATRLESFLTDTHGRDDLIDGELALDADGRFLALKVESQVGVGAYASTFMAIIITNNTKNCLSSVYRVPAIHFNVRAILTNAVPAGPYRGAGRPEAIFMVERLIDEAARKLGVDRVELRRRNLIPASAMPYQAPSGQTYDSGEFEVVMDKALQLADWQGFAARRAATEAAGRLRGIGICCFLEVSGGAPLSETIDVRIANDGRIVVRTGGQAMGQGIATTMPLLLARALEVDAARITIVQGDSAEVPAGLPTVASRTTMMAGGALRRASEQMIVKGRLLASEKLEAAAADIEYSAGEFRVAGTDRGVSLEALAVNGALDTVAVFTAPEMSFPNGCHICEVEVDPQTGVVQVVAYSAVDDVGEIIHPSIVEGQLHGGIAQGLGQVLGEEVVYDDSGQLLTASFMDYFMPRADDLPRIRLGHHVVACTTNPNGVKGTGESGVAGAIPSATNAVLDALASRGVYNLDLPHTACRVWTALQDAGNR